MKIAIIYNRESQAVINLFGVPNREKYGLETINKIKEALKVGGHQVKAFEGDKNIIRKLEEFMPSVISGERPGLVFNLSYGIQGRGRYMHVPGILEMLGIPYVGSDPTTHAIALDKVVTKMILMQKGLPTPRFTVLDKPDSPLTENLTYPLIVKPKDEAVSFGLRIVHNESELRNGVKDIYEKFQKPTLVEEYIDGREVNVALMGNDPVEALPPVELIFRVGEKIFTYEDKKGISKNRVEKICPAPLSPQETKHIQSLAITTFKALGCFDSARVDFRIDKEGNPYILEVNSMASLGLTGSFVYAAEKVGLDYTALVNRLIDIAAKRYFGEKKIPAINDSLNNKEAAIFNFLTENRDKMEKDLKFWTNLPSRTNDPVGISAVVRKLDERLKKQGFSPVEEFTNMRSTWTWETKAGFSGGTLLVVPVDVPKDKEGYPIPFRRDPELLYGEGIASSRAGIVCILQALSALRYVKQLGTTKMGVFVYSDEGRGMRYSGSILREAAKNAKQVMVLQPGYRGGKIVNQRRGSRKFSILIEGDPLRIGLRSRQVDVLTWFLQRVEKIVNLSQQDKKLSVAVQDVHSERYSILLPHRVRAMVYLTYLDSKLADDIECQIKKILTANSKSIRSYVEKIEERPPLFRNGNNKAIISKLKTISEAWKLPFEIESSLLPSAAGEVPKDIPVICGLSPASSNLYTPHEAIYRGELLQKSLLLTLFLLEEKQ